jgi:hypothetical protein
MTTEATTPVSLFDPNEIERHRKLREMNAQLGQMMLARVEMDMVKQRMWMVTGKFEKRQAQEAPLPISGPRRARLEPKRLIATPR